MKVRKKPIVIEAVQWDKRNNNDAVWNVVAIAEDCCTCHLPMIEHGLINTLEGRMTVCPGDWIITGVKGEKYPCKPDIFEMTYEKVDEDN